MRIMMSLKMVKPVYIKYRWAAAVAAALPSLVGLLLLGRRNFFVAGFIMAAQLISPFELTI